MEEKKIETKDIIEAVKRKNKGLQGCQAYLGSKVKVDRFAGFYHKNKDDIDAFLAAKVVEFCEERSYTPQEFLAFKLGLYTFSSFMEECMEDSPEVDIIPE